MCGTIFDEISDLKKHVENRHEKPREQEDTMKTLDVKHFLSILREENLDLFEEMRSFKKAVFQGFKDILACQETMKDDIMQMVESRKKDEDDSMIR